MPIWQVVLDLVGIVLLVAFLFLCGVVIRRRLLARPGGSFELSYRARSTGTGRGWLLGVGRYRDDVLEWFRFFSLAPRARHTWLRSELTLLGHRDPVGAELYSLYSGHVVVQCETAAGPQELAMSPSSLTGFRSWLEAMPPGSRAARPGDDPVAG